MSETEPPTAEYAQVQDPAKEAALRQADEPTAEPTDTTHLERIAGALERIADTQGHIHAALLLINSHVADVRDALYTQTSTVDAETAQYRHATELAGRPMHAALKVSAPKGFICPACDHWVNLHRQFGCDSSVDGALCECTAPYGRPPRQDSTA